jgi:hypothetical protein
VSTVADVDALEMLAAQHDEIANLFDDLEDESSLMRKRQLWEALADALAVHVTIEERHFYPAARAANTDEILGESMDEHLAIKRVLSDMLMTPIDDETFDAKASALRELVEAHVEEEERDLFPKVELLLDENALVAIAGEMMATQEALVRRGDPRLAIPQEAAHAPDLVSLR